MSAGPAQGWLSHRTLLWVETVLVVGLVKEALEWLVLERAPVDPLIRVLAGMVVVAGTLGGLVVVLQTRVRKSLDRTYQLFRRRYRLPILGLHLVVLVSIFVSYAAFWNEETGAQDRLWAALAAGWARLSS